MEILLLGLLGWALGQWISSDDPPSGEQGDAPARLYGAEPNETPTVAERHRRIPRCPDN